MSLFSWLSGSKNEPSKGSAIPSSPRAIKTTTQPDSKLSSCPNCNVALEKIPARKTICKKCQKPIFVRTTQHIYDSVLLTESQALVADTLKENEYLGFSQEVFRNLLKNRKEGFRDLDVLWGYFGQLNAEAAEKGDLQQLKMLQNAMALMLNREGKDCFHCLQAAARYDLMIYQRSGAIKKVQIVTIQDSCDACKKLSNKVLDVDVALKELPVPCRECSRKMFNQKFGFCRCQYLAFFQN